MMPALLAAEIDLLRERGENVDIVDDGSRFLLIVNGFQLPDGRFQTHVTDLLIIADYQYPMSRLDMFWTDPPVMLSTGGFPQAADNFEVHGGRRWQRWSWHYPGWNPSQHNVRTHIEVFRDRLARIT